MSAAKNNNSKSLFDVLPVKEIGFSLLVLFGVNGCFESASEQSPPPVEPAPRVQDSQTSSDGAALYAANCAGCHGTDGSSIVGNTPTAITAAINNIAIMSGVSLSAADIQAISDFMTGNSGGGSGGGSGSGGGGSLDGAALYAANCSACHGADGSSINGNTVDAINTAIANLAIMSGVSLSAAEIQAISDFLTGNTGGNTGGGGASDGATLYANHCAACHGADGSALADRTGSQIAAAIVNVSTMTGIALSGTEMQSIADFLATGSVGQLLYEANCAGCHGADGSTLSGRSSAQIATAIVNEPTMSGITLSGTDIQAIADFLGGGSSGGGSTGGPPASHTNPEDGILHAPGNTLPFTNGCTLCHGTTLEGGVGPSCFACHGVEWNESAPSGDGGSGVGNPGDGLALYTTYCAACHGVTGSSLAGRTADQISIAISNVATMNSIALSLTELHMIADYLAGGGDTGGGSGALDGATLFADNCAACHGDGSAINDPSVNGITAAMSIGFMSGVNVTADEIQAISDFLTGSTGGGDTGGGGTPDGATLYANNCSACHGDGSGINDSSVSGITSALNLSFMNNITLTSAEIQAISDFLSGGVGGGDTGGGTGGGDTGGGTGGLPSSHTNSEEGVLHADGNNTPYTSGCTACHGTTLQGAIGPSCFACHGIEWTESAPGGGDTGGGDTGGGTMDGATLYTNNCSACHGDGSGINDSSVSGITSALNLSFMNNITLSSAEIQAISDYLSGGTGGGDTGGGTGGGTTDGATLYTNNCSACHGDGSGINDSSVSGITSALNLSFMNNIALTSAEIQAISDYLSGGTGGGDTGGGDTGGGTGGVPTSHTNPEDGILHAPGNNYPFTNGCTACHGSTLQGGIGPSCFACHGIEWNENAPSGGGDTGGGTGGATTDGATLYANNCAACHGATGSNINGRTASAISSAIAGIGSMNNISLTSTEIQAIADYLAGSTGGGSTGGDSGDTGGLPSTHTNSEGGVLHAQGNDYPYTNGCTSCHGSSLQGGIGPSCFACHGVEWRESAPSSGGSDGGSDGGSEEEEGH